MAVTPTGIISEPLNLVRELVAGSTNFQTWVGAANQAAALLRVYGVARAPGWTRPYCLVTAPENFRWEPGMGTFARGIGFSLIFEANTDPAFKSQDLHQDATYTFTNTLGAVIADMINYNAGSVADAFRNTFELPVIQRSDTDVEDEDYFQAIVRLTLCFSGGR